MRFWYVRLFYLDGWRDNVMVNLDGFFLFMLRRSNLYGKDGESWGVVLDEFF